MMKVAIVSSGLGHINRGVENWARETAYLLKDDAEVKLFKGSGRKSTREIVVPCIKRNSLIFGGIKSPIPWIYRYYTEQASFSFSLLPKIRDFDIVQSADPLVVDILQRSKKIGLLKKPEIIYTNQSSSSADICKKYDHVQVLAPYYLELGEKIDAETRKWFVIPNFADIEKFKPDDSSTMRKKLGIPENALIILSVGPIGFSGHKRMEWLIEEISLTKNNDIYLVIIGDKEKNTEEFMEFGKKKLGNRIIFKENMPNGKMPEYYSMSDVFILCSLSEPFGIVFLEAMASGKPVIGHEFPVTKWIIGDGGMAIDMNKKGEIAEVLGKLDAEKRRKLGEQGRQRVVEMFSREKVKSMFLKMYQSVLNE